VVVNKIDLKLSDECEEVTADLRTQAVAIFPCSAKTGEGLDHLQTALAGKCSVLAGASGVGKTSLINAIVPHVEAATRPVREKDNRGRHTTSQARLYDLHPSGLLVDTPGIRELGVGITPAELTWYFPEFEEFAAQCKFSNCSHTHEPQCAVIQAVEKEKIFTRRYESYLRILDTLG
jgi:ribosome biogenesis GTPase